VWFGEANRVVGRLDFVNATRAAKLDPDQLSSGSFGVDVEKEDRDDRSRRRIGFGGTFS